MNLTERLSSAKISRLHRTAKRASNPEFVRFWAQDVPARLQITRQLARLRRFHGGESVSFESLVEERTTKIAKYAFARSPYYRRLFVEHDISLTSFMEDLPRVPLLDKSIIRSQGSSLLAMPHSKEELPSFTTGGSTGEPLAFLACGGFDQAHQKFLFEMMGYKGGDRILAMDGSIVPVEARAKGVFWVRKSAHELPYGSFGLSSQYLTTENIGDYLNFILEFKPQFIRGYPSFIDAVGQYMLDSAVHLEFSIKAIELTSESHSGRQAERITQAFGAPTFDQYGHAEGAVFGYSLGSRSALYCSPMSGYTEVLDEDGAHVGPGQVGEVVVTGFHNYAMPFIRYRTGDLALYEGNESGVVRFSRVIGRTQDYVYTESMEKVLLTALIFGRHLRAFERIRKWQLVQDVPGVVIFRIIADGEFGIEQEGEIRSACTDSGIGDVSFEYPVTVPITARGKSKLLVQNVDPRPMADGESQW